MQNCLIAAKRKSVFPFSGLGCLVACTLLPGLTGCSTTGPVDPPLNPEQWTAIEARAQPPSTVGVTLKKHKRADNITVDGVLNVPLGSKHLLPFIWKEHKDKEYPALSHKVNGHRVLGLLATSLPMSLIDFDASQRVGLRVLRVEDGLAVFKANVLTPDGRLPFYPGIAQNASFGDTMIHKVPFGILDREHGLLALDWLQGLPAETLIGSDLLRTYDRATIDLENGTVTLASGEHKTDPEKLLAATHLVKGYVNPVIEVRLNGKGPVPVALATCLDTGLHVPGAIAFNLELPGSVFASVSENHGIFPAGVVEVDIAGIDFGATPAQIAGYPPYRDAPPYAFLGSKFLREYIVTLDFGTSKVYFEKR